MNIKITEHSLKEIFNSTITEQKDPEEFFTELGTLILNNFLSVRVIGELAYSLNTEIFEAFKEILKAFFTDHPPSCLKKINTKESRAVISLYLVWAGTGFYIDEKERPFWPYIFEGLGIKDVKMSGLFGHMFMDCLNENELELFEDVSDRQGYVTRILFHGLIPPAYIDIFMKEFMEPDLSGEIHENGKNLINKWINEDEKIRKIPKGLQSFLQYGNPVNSNIVDKILCMAERWHKDKPVIYWQWGLPEYIVKSFHKFFKESDKIYRHDVPCILFNPSMGCAPFIITAGEEEREINCKILKQEKEEYVKINCREYSPAPSEEWHVKIHDKDYIIHGNFPETDGMKIPLFIFNGKDYKLVNNKYADELFFIYSEESDLRCSAGYTVSMPLYGKWKGWKALYCKFDCELTVYYSGPDITFSEILKTDLLFKTSKNLINKPLLVTEDKIPSWIRCSDDIPVITHPRNLKMSFTVDTLLFWRNASCEVVRTGSEEEQQSLFQINYEPEDKSIFVPLKSPVPGLYEIHVRGSIGMKDIILPFVYLPFEEYKREFSPDNPHRAKSFSLVFSRMPEFKPLENTSFKFYGNKVNFFPEEDRGEASLGMKLFPGKGKDVTLFLDRSYARWAKVHDSDVIHWYDWKSVNECFPAQEIDTFHDSKILVSADEAELSCKDGILTFLLEISSVSEKFPLISCEYGRFKSLWVLELNDFISQLKSFGDFRQADIIMKYKNMSLFTWRRITEFENLTIESLKNKNKTEEIKINWKENPVDFMSDRILRLYPIENPDKIMTLPLKDFEKPPVVMNIKSPAEGGVWSASLYVRHDRHFDRPVKETFWMRIPDRWVDWLDWNHINRDRPLEVPEIWEKMEEEKKISLTPWSYFSYLFYNGKDRHLIDEFKSLTGKEIIIRLIPFSRGSLWDVKDDAGTKMTLEVTSSSLDNTGEDSFYACSPSDWYNMPPEIELTLSDINGGEIWSFIKKKHDIPRIISSSGDTMSVDKWLKDILKSNTIQAKMPLESIWHKSLYLPVLKWIDCEDQIFAAGKNPSGIISDLIDPEINRQIIKLLDRWKNISLDPLLVKLLSERIRLKSPDALTGAVAFICRLKSRGYEISSELESLIKDTFDFIKKFLQRAFLRDLILAEIFISWYAENLIWKI
ncbi:MAG: hypothetical protein ABRQ39_13660 [Candidatus Eremiobacterota bacterium]